MAAGITAYNQRHQAVTRQSPGGHQAVTRRKCGEPALLAEMQGHARQTAQGGVRQ